MNEKRYILKKGDYYLADIMVDEKGILTNYTVDRDYRKLYADFELAEEDRKLIYIETGLAFEVKLFKKEEEAK